MNAIIITVLPVFALIAAGFAAARFGLFEQTATEGLNRFVLLFAIPALLFGTMAKIDIGDVAPWGLWAGYYGAVALVWLVTLAGRRRVPALAPAGGAAAGITATFGNLVLLGLPLAFFHYGDKAVVPAALIIVLHAPVQWFIATLVAEWSSRAKGQPVSGMAIELIKNLAANPLISAMALGFAWNLTGLGLHPAADKVITMLGQAGVPSALFALGLSVAGYSFRGQLGAVAILLVLKLALMPLIAAIIAVPILGLDAITAAIVILFAAMPPGVNAYLFAVRYDAAKAPVSGAVVLGTGLAVLTASAVLWWLGPVG
jgi:predicted permease